MWIAALTLTWLGSGSGMSLQRSPIEVIQVFERVTGCFAPSEGRHYQWSRDGDSYRLGRSTVSLADVGSIRTLLLSSTSETRDVLASIGVTAETVLGHEKSILPQAHPLGKWVLEHNGGKAPSAVRDLLRSDELRAAMLDHLLYRGWSSTGGIQYSVTLPGKPAITATSRTPVGWMLPWRIEADGRTWESANVEISKALLRFADDASVVRATLNGTQYWSSEFWTESSFWFFQQERFDAPVCEATCTLIPGFDRVADRFRIESSRLMNLESLQVDLKLPPASPIDRVRWWIRIDEGSPTSDWTGLFPVHDRAAAAVQKEPWIDAWRNMGLERSVRLDVAGKIGMSRPSIDRDVISCWHHAGFEGEPEWQLHLDRSSEEAATVHLSSEQTGGIITSARAAAAGHWLDGLELFLSSTDTLGYVRVDPHGSWQRRTFDRRTGAAR